MGLRRNEQSYTCTHVSVAVEDVIGQLEFLEGDGLARQLFPGQRWVGVRVETWRYRWVGLAGNQPRRTVIGVAVTLAVHRNNIHQYDIAGNCVHAAETYPHCRKHSSKHARNISVYVPFTGTGNCSYKTSVGSDKCVSAVRWQIIIIVNIRFHGLRKLSAFIAQLVAVDEFVQSVLEDLQWWSINDLLWQQIPAVHTLWLKKHVVHCFSDLFLYCSCPLRCTVSTLMSCINSLYTARLYIFLFIKKWPLDLFKYINIFLELR